MADRDLHHLIGRDLPSRGGDAHGLSAGPDDRIGPLRSAEGRARRDRLAFAALMIGLSLAAGAATFGAVHTWNSRPAPSSERKVAARSPDSPPPALIVPPPPSAFETIPMADLPSSLPTRPPEQPPATASLPATVPLDGPPVPAPLRPEPVAGPADAQPDAVQVPQAPARPVPSDRASKSRHREKPKQPQAAPRPPFRPQPVVGDVDSTGSSRPLPVPSKKPPAVAAKEPTTAPPKEPSTWNLPSVLRPGGL